MVVGVPYTRKGITRDSKYTYVLSVDDSVIAKNDEDTDDMCWIHVNKTSEKIDRRTDTDVNTWNKHKIILPFRTKFYLAGNLKRNANGVHLDWYSNDFDDYISTDTVGMIECWVKPEYFSKYQDNMVDVLNYSVPFNDHKDFRFIWDVQKPGSDNSYVGARRHSYKYNSRRNVTAHPESMSIQSFKDVDKRRVYIIYTMNHNVFLHNAFFCYTSSPLSYGSVTPLFSGGSYDIGHSRYKKNIEGKYSIPVVMELRYHDGEFERVGISCPVASSSNLIDSGLPNKAFNYKTIPEVAINASLGNLFDQGSGSAKLHLPSNNRCLTNSYLDYDEEDLMIVTTYESATGDSSISEPTLYVSKYSTTSNIDPLPNRMVSKTLDSILKEAGLPRYGKATNISTLDITKWKNNYIISISYDKGSRSTMNTVLLKMPVGTSYSASDIEVLSTLKNIGSVNIQGLEQGRMT